MSSQGIEFKAFFPKGRWGSSEPLMIENYSSGVDFECFGFWSNEDSVVYLQYSGFKDRNGTKIFKGDIIDSESGRFIVNYDKGAFVRETVWLEMEDGVKVTNVLDPVHTLYDTVGIENCIVVGNIHQNSELID